MVLGDLSDEGQAQTHPLGLGGDKRLAEAGDDGRGRSWTIIPDFHEKRRIFQAGTERDGSVRAGRLDGIEGQVEERGLQRPGIPLQLRIALRRGDRQSYTAMFAGGGDQLGNVLEQCLHREGCRWSWFIATQ